ncbi:MAG: ATP-binding protein [Leptolyngbyaceae cyanobacterium]
MSISTPPSLLSGDRHSSYKPLFSSLTLASGLLLISLVVLGCIGTYFNLEMFLGVNFLFGSIFSLVIVYFYGLIPGTIAAIVISTYTYMMWGHPYAIIIFAAEAAFVGVARRFRRLNLITLDSVYWIGLGAPLVWLFYAQVMQIPTSTTLLITAKQVCNGLFNALIADLVVAHIPITQLLGKQQVRQPLSMQQTLAYIFVAFVFVPAMLLTILSSREALSEIEVQIPAKLQTDAALIMAELESWQQQQQTTLAEVAQVARQVEDSSLGTLQQSVNLLQRTVDGSDRIYVTNGQNVVIASAPNPPSTTLPVLEKAVLLDGPQGDRFVQSMPLDPANPSSGKAVIETSLNYFSTLLKINHGNPEYLVHATLLNDTQVIQTTRPELTETEAFDHLPAAESRFLAPNTYHWLPAGDMPTFARWKQSAYVYSTPLSNEETGWTLMVESPAAPYFDELQIFYIQRISLTLAIVFASILVSYLISRQLAQPIYQLAHVTTDLPNRLSEQEKFTWPESNVLEINALIANFIGMAKSLEQQFQTIQQTNATLEERIAERTQALSATNQSLQAEVEERQRMAEALEQSEADLRQKASALKTSMTELQQTQTRLVQAEKMSSLGQLVAGIAHEINNPVNFIHGNLSHVRNYTNDLLELIALYEHNLPDPSDELIEVIEDLDLDFLKEDLPKIVASMQLGTNRIRQIVLSLRNFSRTDEGSCKAVDLHEGIESTLLILQYRLKTKSEHPAIQIIKNYGDLSPVECYPGQINQVFMNILSNAIDAIEEFRSGSTYQRSEQALGIITITTFMEGDDWAVLTIEDDGPGIPKEIQNRIFEPFFTTKEIGKGTGMGMSISYQIIVEQHRGLIYCQSLPDRGTKFVIRLPVRPPS